MIEDERARQVMRIKTTQLLQRPMVESDIRLSDSTIRLRLCVNLIFMNDVINIS